MNVRWVLSSAGRWARERTPLLAAAGFLTLALLVLIIVSVARTP